VRVAGEEAVGAEPVDERAELVALEHVAAHAGGVPRVVAELHRVDRVDLDAEQLQREHRRLVADVAVHDVRLDREHARARERLRRPVVLARRAAGGGRGGGERAGRHRWWWRWRRPRSQPIARSSTLDVADLRLAGVERTMPEWSETTAQVLKSHGVSEKSGLSASQVARLTAEHGKNELAQEEATPLWKLVLAQFDDLLVKILLGAAVLSFVLACFEEGEGVEAFVEPFVILLILVINAVVGVWQEHNAESALEALKQMQSATAKCIRGGELVPDLPAEELVPGDIVEIGVGDKVPADVRILRLKTTTVRTDEGALTGESETVMKQTEPVAKSVRIQASRPPLRMRSALPATQPPMPLMPIIPPIPTIPPVPTIPITPLMSASRRSST
jgi:magnesium-transporting ATPase (P-type)